MSRKASLNYAALALGPVLCLIFNFSGIALISPTADKVISVALWMVIWWITEAVSISVTALLPLLLFPLMGIMSFAETSRNYGSSVIFLFFGGFVLALAMEKVHLHKRIALHILKITGNSLSGMLLGLMIATSFLSMWISNTATTLVILPIALTIVNYLNLEEAGVDPRKVLRLKIACMLGIAYAANIGGTATIIGTPPNVVLIGFMEETLSEEVDFTQWVIIAFPFTFALFLSTFLVLKLFFFKDLGSRGFLMSIVHGEIQKMGKPSQDEYRVLGCFAVTIALWIFRNYLNDLTGLKISNSHIAIFGAMLTFVLPSTAGNTRKLMEWADTKNLQWGILILFGGGLALAQALSDAGIIQYIGEYTKEQQFRVETTIPFLSATMLLMTELMSNVALVAVFAPMISGISQGMEFGFLELGIPVALASSCAFMLPMSTPPNAIVYSSGFLKVIDMLKVGVVLNLLAIIFLTILSFYWVPFVLANY